MKILAKSSLQKRAIRVGLLSHLNSSLSVGDCIVATKLSDLSSCINSHPRTNDCKKILACIDAFPLVNIAKKTSSIDFQNYVDALLFVGDIGRTSEIASKCFGIPCRNLFKQEAMIDTINSIKNMNIFYRSRVGYYPSIGYALKDLARNSLSECFPLPLAGRILILRAQTDLIR